MNGRPDNAVDRPAVEGDFLPDSLRDGSTVLVASTADPARWAIGLQILCQRGTAADTAFVVTTTESADRTIETYADLGEPAARPSLGIVDTTSEQQSIASPYGETPTVFTPSPEDLERLVLALSDLAGNTTPSSGARHLVVRSLTPILESTSPAQVRSVLDRITGLRTEPGLCLLGLEYTAHDPETVTTLADHVDGVLWATRTAQNRLEFEYDSANDSRNHLGFTERTDD